MLHHDAFELLNAPMKKMALELKGAVLATGYVLFLLLPILIEILLFRLAACCYLLSWFQTVLLPLFLAIFLMFVVVIPEKSC